MIDKERWLKEKHEVMTERDEWKIWTKRGPKRWSKGDKKIITMMKEMNLGDRWRDNWRKRRKTKSKKKKTRWKRPIPTVGRGRIRKRKIRLSI